MAEAIRNQLSRLKPNKRDKEVLRLLKKQVEFYFGDMNLRKGFLRAKIDQSEDGFVPIKLIASFNRVKALTSDVSVVTSAMRRSNQPEVSADGEKVRRSTPLADPQDVDERTVYVEDLPPDSSVDTIMRDFGRCGSVEYIQLPRCENSKDLKGFAYVTFSKPEEALKALKVFDNFESGLEPLFPAKAQSSSTPSTMEVGRDWEGRGGVLVAEGEGQSSRSGRKRRCDDNDGSYNSTDGKRSDINDDEQSAGAAPPQAKMKKDKDILHDEEGDAKANKKKKGKRWRKKAKKYPYKVLHQLEWNRLEQLYVQLQKQETSGANEPLAEHSESAPQPPFPAKTIATKAPAVTGGQECMRAMSKRGADEVQ